MYVNIVFIFYMAAMFSGLIGIIIMLLTAKNNKAALVTNTTLFIVSAFFYCTFYFIFFYRERVLGLYELGLSWRILDYFTNPLILFFWILVVLELQDSYKVHKKIIILSFTVLLARFIFTGFMTSFYMDDYYNITDAGLTNLFFIIETSMIIFNMIILVICSLKTIRHTPLKMVKTFIFITSASLIIFNISQSYVNYNLYRGFYGISAWEFTVFDPTGILFLIINLAAVVFILKTDFSPIYISSQRKSDPSNKKIQIGESDVTSLLDISAEKHRLTAREREVLELVYMGYSNPDIAAELYISINTVKRHLNHIFEKLCVSTRIELIHLVNSQASLLGVGSKEDK